MDYFFKFIPLYYQLKDKFIIFPVLLYYIA